MGNARLVVVLLGMLLFLVGAVMLTIFVATPWISVNGISSNTAGLVVGGFLTIVGVLVVFARLGVVDEVLVHLQISSTAFSEHQREVEQH